MQVKETVRVLIVNILALVLKETVHPIIKNFGLNVCHSFLFYILLPIRLFLNRDIRLAVMLTQPLAK